MRVSLRAAMASFSDPGGSATSKKSLINLLRGWPHPSLLPTTHLQRATQNVLRNPDVSNPGMLYGPDAGFPGLRENLAAWLTKFYRPANNITAQRISVSGGASQSLGCILNVYTDPVFTRNVWCVAPAYMLAFRMFEDAGFKSKLRAVPEDNEGLNIEALKEGLRKSEEAAKKDGNTEPKFKPQRPWGKVYRHIIYAVPTFSNPSFKTMTLQRRLELVRVAREYDALVITDDVYDFLQWPNDSKGAETAALSKAVQPRIVDIDSSLEGGPERDGADGFGNAASNGSFSKIAGPGFRTGWVEGSAKFTHGVSQAGTTRSGGAASQLTATFVSDMLETGALQDHIATVLQPAYARRYHIMLAAIQTHLVPLGVRLPQTDREVVGGYFIWLTLPEELDCGTVSQRAKEDENLVVAPGTLFEVPGDNASIKFAHDLRICFAWEDEDKLAEGIERLGTVIKAMLDGGGKPHQADEASQDKSTKNFW